MIPAVLTIPFVLLRDHALLVDFAVWAKVFCALACLVLFERGRSLGRLLIGRRLRLRKLMLHAEFLHRNLTSDWSLWASI